MPEIRGVELVKRVRAEDPSIPILILTGQGQDEPEPQLALQNGANGFIAKPFGNPATVRDIVLGTIVARTPIKGTV